MSSVAPTPTGQAETLPRVDLPTVFAKLAQGLCPACSARDVKFTPPGMPCPTSFYLQATCIACGWNSDDAHGFLAAYYRPLGNISQAELAALVLLKPLAGALEVLEYNLNAKFFSGATVEPGPLDVQRNTFTSRKLTWESVKDCFGPDKLSFLEDSIVPTVDASIEVLPTGCRLAPTTVRRSIGEPPAFHADVADPRVP
ncbi:MAG: hypothetical protein K8U03_11750 [Planctomycetia bacterium]|nr:hypothetical protein [Planctomycetia bacterium]